MATIFTRIIDGEIPSRMVWEDDLCVAFLDVRPLAPGHCLVVPRAEVDQWTDLEQEMVTRLMSVAHVLAAAQISVFEPSRVGLMIAGFEVPHTHVHVVPIDSMSQLDFANADTDPDQGALDEHLVSLREALVDADRAEVSSR